LQQTSLLLPNTIKFSTLVRNLPNCCMHCHVLSAIDEWMRFEIHLPQCVKLLVDAAARIDVIRNGNPRQTPLVSLVQHASAACNVVHVQASAHLF
jgi:hypothetical protein